MLSTALALASAMIFPSSGEQAAHQLTSSEQEGAAPAAVSGTPSDERGRDASAEIVVTAQKRSERLEEVPVTITYMNQKVIQDAGIRSIDQIGQVSAGVSFSHNGTFAAPSIRGITSTFNSPGAEANIAIYVDGYYQPSESANVFDLVNIESVSVLKGPQGTVFGRNATGGAIVVTTLKPSFTPTGTFRASYGRFNDFRASGYLSGGLVPDVLAASISAYVRRSDGYIHDIFTGGNSAPVRTSDIRAKLLFTPAPAFEATLSYEHSVIDDATPLEHNARRASLAKFLDPTVTIATEPFTTSQYVGIGRRQHYKVETDFLTLTAKAKLGKLDLTSYTSGRWQVDTFSGDNGDSPNAVRPATYRGPTDTYTQEVNLSSSGNPDFNWVAGVYYLNDKTAYNDLIVIGLTSIRSFVRTRSLAGFFDGTYQLSSRLALTAGARYTHDRRSLAFSLPATAAPTTASASWEKFTPRIALRYEVAPRTNIYASYSRGFKSGTFNGSSASTTPVNPENLTAVEVGLKTVQGGIRFDVSGFHYDYSDLQVLSQDLRGTSIALLQNAGSAEVYGMDGQLDSNLSDRLQVRLGAAWTHARFKSFPNAQVFVPGPSGVNVAAFVDASGKRLPFSPDFSGNLSATYRVPVGSTTVELFGNVAYSSMTTFTPDEREQQPAYALLNLRATWIAPGGHLKASVFGNNVTDVHHILVDIPNNFGDLTTFAEPATYGVSLEWSF